jgi:ferritin-like metal-binding protein YciE
MAQLIDLRDLLKHEILDLYSAEEQIIEALPQMAEKATNVQLKKALRDHLKITEAQKSRLDEIKGLMSKDPKGEDFKGNKGFFSKLFGGLGGEKCKGTEGLIKEGEKMMSEDMTAQVMDAAIIGAAQKIEHYEISGYGTAVAYARELGLSNVAGLLKQTLDEEYAADDSLTELAVGKLNVDAENVVPSASKMASSKAGGSKKTSPSKNASPRGANLSKSSMSKGASKSNDSDNSDVKRSKSNLSKSSKSSGNKSAGKSIFSKSAVKSGVRSLSKDGSKSGKGKSSKRR